MFVHRGIGTNQDSYICLNRTYRKRCPICDYQEELRTSGEVSEEDIKLLNPTKRTIYNIVNCDTVAEEGRGIQVFDVSHWLFTIPLEEFAHKKRTGGEIAYADIDDGKIISFRQKGSKRTLEYTAFEFKDRPEITDDQLDAAICLDEMIHVPTFEEVYEAFMEGKEEKIVAKEEVRKPKEEVKKEEVKKEEVKKPAPVEVEEDVPESVESDSNCPYGAAYGADYNAYEECRGCDVRKLCLAEKDRLDAVVAPVAEKKKLTRRGA